MGLHVCMQSELACQAVPCNWSALVFECLLHASSKCAKSNVLEHRLKVPPAIGSDVFVAKLCCLVGVGVGQEVGISALLKSTV